MESVFSWSHVQTMESCHHQCLKAVCVVLGFPKGLASELLDGTLKLRHLYHYFYHAFFSNGFYPGLEMGVVKGSLLLLVISWMKEVTWVKGSGNQEDTSRCIFSLHSGSGASNADEMEKTALPFLRSRGR